MSKGLRNISEDNKVGLRGTVESEKCERLFTTDKFTSEGSTYYICQISQKQTYQNNMEPGGTSQQESGGVWSFLEMESIRIQSFRKTNINK